MKIVVCVKHVPDAQSERSFASSDHTTDRESVDGLLSELDEYAVEEALKIKEAGQDCQVTAVTMGPAKAVDALKKALQMGVDDAVHIIDDALAGSDALSTSLVLAQAVRQIGDVDLVLLGMASTDGIMSVLPAMLAERLGLPQVTFASELTLAEGTARMRRDSDAGTEIVEATLPAVISVTDQINEPRYPSFKGIMAAKKKPLATWSLADVGVDPAAVGLGAAATTVTSVSKRPPRQQGLLVSDDGQGGEVLAQFLSLQKMI